MRQSNLSWILLLPLFILLSFVMISRANITRAASADHVVISEIQIAGATTTDEFVELYNPTSFDVNLNNWQLARKTQGGTQSILVSTLSGTIKSHGFYLISSPHHTGSASADSLYTTENTISNDNSVILYSDQGLTVIDKLGIDNATDSEASAFPTDPSAGKSIERKAHVTSTTLSMTSGSDLLLGNAEDTDNNADDFVLRNTSQPQNSTSPIEPAATPTPIQEPTSTPTPTLEPTPTEEPEPTITPTPTPTSEPTSTPTPTESEPTTTPTVTPTPTLIPTNTPVPTITPTITPTPRFPHFHVSCTTRYRSFRFFHTIIQIPMVSCRLLSN